MSYYSASALINTIVIIALASFVFLKNPRGTINRIFSLFLASSAFWSFCYFLWQTSNSPETALFWTRALMLGAIFIPILQFHFVLLFLNKLKENLAVLISGYFVFLLFVILNSTSLFIEKVKPLLSFQFWPQPGIAFHPFLIVWFGYLLYTVLILLKSYKLSSGIIKNQIRYMLLGILVAFIGGSTNYLLWYEIPIPPYGNILTSLYIASFTYAIVKHRLMDIRFVVARTVAYSLLLLITASFYTGSLFLLSSYFYKGNLGTGQLVSSAILTLVIALTFQPLKKFLEHITDKVFFKETYDTHKLLSELSHIMATNISLRSLTHQLLEQILKEMRISRGVFILTDSGNVFDIEAHGYKETPKFTKGEILSLLSKQKMAVFEELEESPLKELLRKLDITVAAPLRVGETDIGILLLGEKLSGDIYSDQDLKLLEIFSPEASVAIQNALSYEEIKRFNLTLKEEVEKATKEVRIANEKLKDLDKLKDEFISITSHDLRTPMTAIKSYLWLIIHGKAGKIEHEKMRKYLDLTYQSSERMLVLINDLLNVSRIESGRIELTLQPTALEDMINLALSELMGRAQEKHIKLTFAKTKEKLPLVMLDRERFPEILSNLVGNALKFTPEKGQITVSAVKNNNCVEVAVKDTGIGIAQKDMPKLFTKFGRLDNSYTGVSTIAGTGLGLYITKNLVQLHGGRIWVESKPQKGTTFSFSVKIATNEDIKREGNRPVETKPTGVIYAPTH